MDREKFEMSDRIVITGIGIISPIGTGKENFWHNLTAGTNGFRPISLFDTARYRTKLAAEITDFDPKVYLGSKGLRYFDRVSLLITSAAKLAVQDGNLEGVYQPDDLGAVIGSTFGSINSISSFDLEALREGPNYVSPMDFPNTVLNAPAARVAIQFEMKGLNSTISNAETSSLDAVQYAADFLRLHRVKALLVGGAYALTPDTYWGFYESRALSGSIEGTEEICAPLNDRHNGIMLGEGAAVMVVESENHARSRGAHIYGYVSGYGNVFNPNPEADDSEWIAVGTRAIKQALEEANLKPDQISLILTGANSSPKTDRTQIEIINEAFGPAASTIPVNALKSQTGECLDASGAFQTVAALMAISSGQLPPTVNGPVDSGDGIKHVLITGSSFTGNSSALIISSADM
jgi:3-oxoacyl-[acyl-carrier-protein] synthase II